MSSDLSERNKLNAYRFAAVVFAQWIVQTFTLVLRDKFSGPRTADMSNESWHKPPGARLGSHDRHLRNNLLCLLIITFATTKERVTRGLE